VVNVLKYKIKKMVYLKKVFLMFFWVISKECNTKYIKMKCK